MSEAFPRIRDHGWRLIESGVPCDRATPTIQYYYLLHLFSSEPLRPPFPRCFSLSCTVAAPALSLHLSLSFSLPLIRGRSFAITDQEARNKPWKANSLFNSLTLSPCLNYSAIFGPARPSAPPSGRRASNFPSIPSPRRSWTRTQLLQQNVICA
jgi:hypothetical protein